MIFLIFEEMVFREKSKKRTAQKRKLSDAQFFFSVVRLAAHVSNGNPPGSGNDIAKDKGVCCEIEFEESWVASF